MKAMGGVGAGWEHLLSRPVCHYGRSCIELNRELFVPFVAPSSPRFVLFFETACRDVALSRCEVWAFGRKSQKVRFGRDINAAK